MITGDLVLVFDLVNVLIYHNYFKMSYYFRFEPEYFRLADEKADLKYDSECDKLDYITIPEARNLNDNIQFNRICSSISSGKNISIICKSPSSLKKRGQIYSTRFQNSVTIKLFFIIFKVMKIFKNRQFSATTAGPYYLTLTTNGVSDGTYNRTENGFSINYKRLHNGCE